MNKKLLISLFSIILFRVCAFSQSISSIDPTSAVPGDAITVSLIGIGTHFSQSGANATTFDFGSNVTVINHTVYSPSSASAFIRISSSAPTGNLTITLKSGNETVVYKGFQIIAAAGVVANLEVLPTQTIYVTDFDPGNLSSAPVIFDVSVSNYAASALSGAIAKLTISGVQYGEILTATKSLTPAIQPNATITFTNRDFDQYNMNSKDQPFVNKAMQTGLVPADEYTYSITITNSSGKTIAGPVTGINIINNPGSGLQLISPGAPLTNAPEQISEKNPLFQWFSQETSYDLYIYPVNPGQTSGPDITNNPPVYYQKGITGTSLPYPLSAMPLVQGTTYAWQIIAHSIGSHGDQTQPSPVYWFSVGASTNNSYSTIASIVVQPGDIEIDMNDTFQFTAKAYDKQENVLNVKPVWSVVPPSGGSIDQNGVFIAGPNPMTVAVVATYGDQEEYSTVQINLGGLPWDFEAFFKQVFGLPAATSK